MSVAKTEEIKIRVPQALKNAVKTIADSRFTSESEIVREALLLYLQGRPAALRDTPNSNQAAEHQAVAVAASYVRKKVRKKVGAAK